MKIGLVIYRSLDTLSGGYLYDRKLVEYLLRQGDSVEIVSLPWRSYLSHLTDNFSLKLLQRLGELDADVLIQDELNHPSLFLLNRRLKSKVSYPIVSIVHHLRSAEDYPWWQKPLYSNIERRYLSSVDGLVYISRTTREVVESMLNEANAKKPPGIIAYPCGDRLKPQVTEAEIAERMRDETLHILFVGNLIERKGLHVLLRALQLLGNSAKWDLTVAGDPDFDPGYAEKISRQVAHNGLGKRVHFTGRIGDDELADCMRACHVLAMPSFYEGYGIVYIEGMGFGLPAIGSSGGAAREIIADGLSGFIVPTDDAPALAARISEIIASRQRLYDMSKAALARYRSHPTWDDSMCTIRNFLLKTRGFTGDRT